MELGWHIISPALRSILTELEPRPFGSKTSLPAENLTQSLGHARHSTSELHSLPETCHVAQAGFELWSSCLSFLITAARLGLQAASAMPGYETILKCWVMESRERSLVLKECSSWVRRCTFVIPALGGMEGWRLDKEVKASFDPQQIQDQLSPPKESFFVFVFQI